MNTRLFLLISLLAILPFAATVRADETITVSANSQDISDNLDLRAVATLFGEVNNLEEFENELNSSERHLNNLDLNGDGIVDYLRVVEIGEGQNRLIVLQAVLAKDIYQDVASIYVERQEDNSVTIQVVGDEYLYGTNYIIEPVYIYRPVIYDWFWGPAWVCWNSPFFWGYYPPHYLAYEPWIWHQYHAHIHSFHHHHPRCSYHYANVPRPGMMSMRSGRQAERVIRNDWAQAHPNQNFTARATSRGSQATNAHQMTTERRRTARGNNGDNGSQNVASRPNRTAAQNTENRTFGSTNTRASVANNRSENNRTATRATASNNSNIRTNTTSTNSRASVSNNSRSSNNSTNNRTTTRATSTNSSNIRSSSSNSSMRSSSPSHSSSSGSPSRATSSSSGGVRSSRR